MTDEKFRPGDRVQGRLSTYGPGTVVAHKHEPWGEEVWVVWDGHHHQCPSKAAPEHIELLPAAPAEDTRAAVIAAIEGGDRVIVCGGRNWDDRAATYDYLDRFHAIRPISVVIDGGARGADELASDWSIERGIDEDQVLAKWGRHGKAAGPMRNAEMLRDHHAAAVIAFPGGPGTADMVRQAKKAHVTVYEYPRLPAQLAGKRG